MATGQEWWKLPVPPGWEAKYDPNQGRYFYINHSTRVTTWTDPRQEYYAQMAQQQQQMQQPQTASSARSAQHIQMREVNGQETAQKSTVASDDDEYSEDFESDSDMETSFTDVNPEHFRTLKAKYPDAPDDDIRQVLKRASDLNQAGMILEVAGYSAKKPKPQFVSASWKTLKKEFPSVDDDVVKDVLLNEYNDEGKSRAELISMGYQRVTQQPKKTYAQQRQQVPSQQTKPSTSQQVKTHMPSEVEKQRSQSKLGGEFKNCSVAIVKMALESSMYDEGKARVVLKMMSEDAKKTTPKRTSPSPQATTTSAAPTRVSSPPRTTTATAPSRDINLPSVIPSAFGASLGETSTPEPTAPPRSKVTKATAEASTKVKTTRTKIDSRPSQAIRTQPTRFSVPMSSQSFTNTERVQAVGPNPELVRGTDKSLIITKYQKVGGPNKELRVGPQRHLVEGPQGCVGRDRTMIEGPDGENRNGPEPGLVQGPQRVVCCF